MKISMRDCVAWRIEFDNHSDRASGCDESKTTKGKIDETSCIVMILI
jgi:hypothetical protein